MPTAISGLRRAGGAPSGGTVLIQGCGPVGLATTLLCGLSHATRVIVFGAPSERLDIASQLGATTTVDIDATTEPQRADIVRKLSNGRGADLIVEAAGRREALTEGMELLGRNGRYVILGLYSGAGIIELDGVRLNNNNQQIIGSLGCQPGDVLRSIQIAERHHARLNLAGLVTDRYPLAEADAAIRHAGSPGPIKTVIVADQPLGG
jgi:5-exo-hydroxycamphor dehydrogenase